MTASGQPRVLLHALDPGQRAAFEVLAEQIADLAHAPRVTVTGPGDLHQPASDARAVDAFLDAYPAVLIVLAGSVLPAALIERAHARGIALMLVDAREPVVAGRWRILLGTTRAILQQFEQIHAADALDASTIARQARGAVPVHDTGTLAVHPPAPGCNISELDALRAALGARPVWFAYDLPAEEFEAALLAHAHALRRAHRLVMIVQPRDPATGPALAERAVAVGFVCARRALDEDIDETMQVYIADTDDDPGLFLRLAPVSFLGGSLTPGATAPSALLAASLGSALVFGPHTAPAEAVFLETLIGQGGARRIGVAPALGEILSMLLTPETGADAALKAWTLATEGSEATYAVAQAITDWVHLNRRPG